MRIIVIFIILLSFVCNSVLFRSYENFEMSPEYDCTLGGTHEDAPETLAEILFMCVAKKKPPLPVDFETEFIDDLHGGGANKLLNEPNDTSFFSLRNSFIFSGTFTQRVQHKQLVFNFYLRYFRSKIPQRINLTAFLPLPRMYF